MSEAGAAITRFDFSSGLERGSSMTLYANCLVHRSDFFLETLPLASLASVRVAFERNARWMVWGGVLLFVALVLLGVWGPIAALAGTAAGGMAGKAPRGASAPAAIFTSPRAVRA